MSRLRERTTRLTRVTTRASALAGWTTLVVVGAAVSEIASRLGMQLRSRGISSAPRSAPNADRGRFLRHWARGAARILHLRTITHGPRPAGIFLLVANHLSYLDVVVFAGLFDATFVAKADVAEWPVVGTLCRALQTLFVDRTRKRDLLRVLPLLEDALRSGHRVVLFPEGTTSDGSSVLPFKSPLFEAALRASRPTHVAALRYDTPPGVADAGRAVCWWGDMTFVRHLLGLLALPRITAQVEFAPAPLVGRDRKRLARSAHSEVRLRHQIASRGGVPCPIPSF